MASLKNMKFSFSGAQRVVDERERGKKEREREKNRGNNAAQFLFEPLSLWLLVSSACGDFVPFCRGRERLEFLRPSNE